MGLFRLAAYHASPRERAVQYLFFQGLLGYEHHPRAVNLLIYSRRFLEFCQPRPQSALVLFTLLVVCSRLSRIFVPAALPPPPPPAFFTSFARSSCFVVRRCLFGNVIVIRIGDVANAISVFHFLPAILRQVRFSARFSIFRVVFANQSRYREFIKLDTIARAASFAKLSIPSRHTRSHSRRRGFWISPRDHGLGTQLHPKKEGRIFYFGNDDDTHETFDFIAPDSPPVDSFFRPFWESLSSRSRTVAPIFSKIFHVATLLRNAVSYPYDSRNAYIFWRSCPEFLRNRSTSFTIR